MHNLLNKNVKRQKTNNATLLKHEFSCRAIWLGFQSSVFPTAMVGKTPTYALDYVRENDNPSF